MDTTARVFEGPSCDGLKTWKSSSSSSRFGVFRLPHAKGGSWCGIGAAATGFSDFPHWCCIGNGTVPTLLSPVPVRMTPPPLRISQSHPLQSQSHAVQAGRHLTIPQIKGTRWQYESRRPSLPCRSIHLRMLSGERGRAGIARYHPIPAAGLIRTKFPPYEVEYWTSTHPAPWSCPAYWVEVLILVPRGGVEL